MDILDRLMELKQGLENLTDIDLINSRLELLELLEDVLEDLL